MTSSGVWTQDTTLSEECPPISTTEIALIQSIITEREALRVSGKFDMADQIRMALRRCGCVYFYFFVYLLFARIVFYFFICMYD